MKIKKKKINQAASLLIVMSFILPIGISTNVQSNDENGKVNESLKDGCPPSHYEVEFLPRINVVNISENNDTEYNFLASIPMTIFHHDDKVYQSLLISDHTDDMPTDYIMDDWKTYLDKWEGAQHINFIGNVPDDKKDQIMNEYNLDWEQISNITGDPIAIANQIALHDWKYSDTIVIAPYLTTLTSEDIESISNAAVISSLYNAPLLFTNPSSLSIETLNVIDKINVINAILVEIGDSLDTNINSQLQSAGVSISDDLINETMVVSTIRDLTNQSMLCAILKNWQNLPASLSGARYGGYVLFLPDTLYKKANQVENEFQKLKLPFHKLEEPLDLPKDIKQSEEQLASDFYNWLQGVNGSDPDDLETVMTFHTATYYDPDEGFSVHFDRAISGDPNVPTATGAVTGRMPLYFIGNIALANRGGMYKAVIFANPRPNHVTLAMNAYEVDAPDLPAKPLFDDNYGNDHNVNEIFGWPSEGWTAGNGYFPWPVSGPDLDPLWPPADGSAGHDPGQFAAFETHGYETHFHSGQWAGTGTYPSQPDVPLCGFIEDVNNGSTFLYFSCHGGGTSIAVREIDNGVAQDSGAPEWGEPYWPDDDERVYDGSAGGSFSQSELNTHFQNVHSCITAFNACLMANGNMNEYLLMHGGIGSIGSYTSVGFVGSGWWWNIWAHLVTKEQFPVGLAKTYATARVGNLYTPGHSVSGDDTLHYVYYGDPMVKFAQPNWTSPEPLEININYGGHQPDKPPHSFIVTVDPTEIPIGVESTINVNVKDEDTNESLIANVSLRGWGINEEGQTNGDGNISFTITPPYGENLTLTVEKEDYDTYEGIIMVTGGMILDGEITASVPSLGVVGVLAPLIEGVINGASSIDEFTLAAKGCRIDTSIDTTTGNASLTVTPAVVGTINAVLLKEGHRILPKEIPVLTLHLGISYRPSFLIVDQEWILNATINCTESGTPIEGASVNIQGCGMDETNVTSDDGIAILIVTPSMNGYAIITAQHQGFEIEETSMLVKKANMTVETINEMWVDQQLPVHVLVNNSATGEGLDNATVSISGCGIGITSYEETGSLNDGEHTYFDVEVEEGATHLSGDLSWDGSADIDMKLYDPNNNLVDSSTSTTPGEFIEACNPESGTWQIEIYSYSGSTPSFTLEITIEYGEGVTGTTENGLVTLVIHPTTTGVLMITGSKSGYNNGETTIDVVTGPTGNLDGTVTDSNTGETLEGVNVKLYNSSVDPSGNDPAFVDITDVNGYYSILSMPIGEYTVFVWEFGYEPYYDILEIEENETTTHDISLIPAQTYTIQGEITDSNTGELLWANITVYREDNGEEIASMETLDGHYMVELIPYTYIFEVEAEMHLTLRETIQVMGDMTHDFQLVPAIFMDDVESGENGWTHSSASGPDLWHITDTYSHSADHSWWCGDEISGNYDDDMDDSLITPVLNLTDFDSAMLTFWHKYDFESASYAWDGSDVEISVDGGNWEQIFPVGWYDDYIYGTGNAAFPEGTPVYAHSSNGWKKAEFDLTEYVGHLIQIRFRFGSDGYVHNYEGWYIDDVAIYGEIAAPMPDLTVEEIIFSDDEPLEGDTIFINATIANIGDENVSNVKVRFIDMTLDKSEIIIGNATIDELLQGNQEIVSTEWVTTAGYHIIKVEVDPDGEIDELNEDNNILTKEIIVGSTNIPPICNISFPGDCSVVNETIIISGTASDPDGIIESVWIKIGNGDWEQTTGTTAWSYGWDTTEVENEFYDIRARSYDGETISPTDSVVVTVDNFIEEYYLQWSKTYTGRRYQGAQPIGDADNDGENELLVGGTEGVLRVLKWNGTTYVEQATIIDPDGTDNPAGFGIGDVDNDGLNEIAVVWDYRFSAFKWDGDSYEQIGTSWEGDGTDFAYDSFIGDYDDDGENEVILSDDPSYGDPEITILKWNGNDFVEEAYWNPPGNALTPMAWVADVDNDGSNETICVPGYDLVVLDWTGSSFIATTVDTFSYDTYACVCGDINGNGIPEIAVGLHSPRAYVYEWDGDSYEQIWNHYWPGEGDVIEGIGIGDTDDDGNIELCVGTGIVHILQWDGNDYVEEAILPTEGTLSKIVVGDCDNDGRNEISTGDVLGYPNKESVYKYLTDNPPMCNISFPLNGSIVNGIIIIDGDAFDLDDDLESVFIRIDDGKWIEATVSKGNKGSKTIWSYEWNTSQVEDAPHTIYAGSYDGQRYSVVASIEIIVMNAAPHTFPLYQGWNLITIPVENDYTAKSLIENISGCQIVCCWDSIDQEYECFTIHSPSGYDFPIENGMGYFIGVTEDSNFSVTGRPISNVSIDLHIGWNLIGWFNENSTTAKSLMENITSCEIVCRWDSIDREYDCFTSGSPPEYSFPIEIGMGLFVGVTQESQWHGEG